MKVARTVNRTEINLASFEKNGLTPSEWAKVMGITTLVVIFTVSITLTTLFVVQDVFFPRH